MNKIIYMFFVLNGFVCNAQIVEKDTSFSIYVFEGRYNDSGKEFIKSHEIFKDIKILSGYMIDPKKNDVFDLESVNKYLLKISPNKDDDGVLCINIENRIYHNLRTYEKNSKHFKEAEEAFGKLIKLIRELRPNLKIGIYGIPFRTYYPSQLKWNTSNKLDYVLTMTDIIFPSLYVLYPDKEKGFISNNNYFKQNLDTAFGYADRLGKQVIPFVWYIVHPNNKRFGGELLGKCEMERYLNYIKNYISFANSKVGGVVWWESSRSSFKKAVKMASHLKKDVLELDRNIILMEYSEIFSCGNK